MHAPSVFQAAPTAERHGHDGELLSPFLRYRERLAAGRGGVRSGDQDVPGDCACGNDGRNLRAGIHSEARAHATESNKPRLPETSSPGASHPGAGRAACWRIASHNGQDPEGRIAG